MTMSYVRTKEIPTGSGNYYRYLEESYREGGGVHTRHLAYLGTAGGPHDTSASSSEVPDKYEDDVDELGTTEEESDEVEYLKGVDPVEEEPFVDEEKIISVDGEKVKTHQSALKKNNIWIDDEGIRTVEQYADEENLVTAKHRMSADDNKIVFKTVGNIREDGKEKKVITIDSEYEHKDDIKNLDYDKTERSWSGSQWYIDADHDALKNSIEELRDEGYTIGVKKQVTENHLLEDK